ncbi:hypothetical protein JNB_01130 [Janibacter sp. HTCC2649]|nr:hypothetical protein JNB_01130 [Janibacter sp. HTCC2649]
MVVAEDLYRRVVRLLIVLVCATGATLGFAAGAHATTHSVAGAATPGHHHSPSAPTPQAMDESTQVRTTRRVAVGAVRKMLEPVLAAWAGLRSLVRRLAPPVLTPYLWLGRLRLAGSPEQLSVHRT